MNDDVEGRFRFNQRVSMLFSETKPTIMLIDTTTRLFFNYGASFIQGMVSGIPIVGSISPEGFLTPILLLVVIIVMVVIVAVILVVVVVAIVGVVIVVAIIGVVVVFGGNPPMKASRSFSVFGTMFGHKTANS
ncbi:hypothetical protein Tco_1539362 [Tanacetum coccineum]